MIASARQRINVQVWTLHRSSSLLNNTRSLSGQSMEDKPVDKGYFLYPKKDTLVLLKKQSAPDFPSLRKILLHRVYRRPGSQPSNTFDAVQASIQCFEEFMQLNHRPDFGFFSDLLPHIHRWALDYQDTELDIDLLQAGKASKVLLSRRRIRTILSNAFFLNVLSLRNGQWSYGNINLFPLYNYDSELARQRILSLLSYFAQVVDLTDGEEVVSFERHMIAEPFPDWGSLDVKINVGRVRVFTERMETSDAVGFVNFANKKLHIHKIISSATQEEVLFSTCPEAFVGILICEEMLDTETIIIRNVRRFSEYEGYLNTFRFTGFYPRSRTHDLVSIDASTHMHFTKYKVDRDLNKAYIGFLAAFQGGTEKVVTSHWGCGAFGGEKHFKFLQQVCASAMADVSLDYSTFGDSIVARNFKYLLNIIGSKQLTVADVYHAISGYQGQSKGFFHHVIQKLEEK